MTLRSAVRGVVEALLVRTGVPHLSRRLTRSRALVLGYHNIVPEGCPVVGDRSVHLESTRFAEQLDILDQIADVVPLGSILEAPGAPTRPRVAITFDDAYAGALVYGVPELVKRGMPATVFVAPAFIGSESFWWDALGQPDGTGIGQAFRDIALRSMAGKNHVIRAHAREYGLSEHAIPEHLKPASEQQLLGATENPHISLGSHSWSHPNLTRIPADELAEELTAPLRWLRTRFDRVVPWLAYPYGECSSEVEAAARDAGYRGALCITGGWIRTKAQAARRLTLPRLNVPAGLSRNGFVLRTAGLSSRQGS